MLVKDVLTKIQSKELSVKQLAEQYNVSDRTIQAKIKKLGFKWSPKEAVYEFIGQDETVYAIEFDSLFTAKSNNNSRSESKSKNASIDKSKSNSASAKHKAETTEQEQELDAIDILLSGKKDSSKRIYRGFYFDKDVLDIVDMAGNKSELINQALRKVFKDKGLL